MAESITDVAAFILTRTGTVTTMKLHKLAYYAITPSYVDDELIPRTVTIDIESCDHVLSPSVTPSTTSRCSGRPRKRSTIAPEKSGNVNSERPHHHGY